MRGGAFLYKKTHPPMLVFSKFILEATPTKPQPCLITLPCWIRRWLSWMSRLRVAARPTWFLVMPRPNFSFV